MTKQLLLAVYTQVRHDLTTLRPWEKAILLFVWANAFGMWSRIAYTGGIT